MYTFIVKDNGPDLDIIITRAMLSLSAIAVMVYNSEKYYYLSLFLSITLLLSAVFIKVLEVKFKINKFVLLSGGAVLLFVATRSIAFALILLVYAYLVKFLYKKPFIEISSEGIAIKKIFSKPMYNWNEFSNIILKDGLLTLDYKNNKLIQVVVDDNCTAADENAFNLYCEGFIGGLQDSVAG